MLQLAQPVGRGRVGPGGAPSQRWQVQYSHCPVDKQWTPAINAYLLSDHIMVCVDLAGVDREGIDVSVEPKCLRIRGVRSAPEPSHTSRQSVHILAMEIDHGPFERELPLPGNVIVEEVSARQRNGLLWVRLPLDVGAT